MQPKYSNDSYFSNLIWPHFLLIKEIMPYKLLAQKSNYVHYMDMAYSCELTITKVYSSHIWTSFL